MVRPGLAAAAALFIFGTPALAYDGDGISFQTPSGNIGCEYQQDTDNRLYCVRLEPTMAYIEFYPNQAFTGDYEGENWFPENAGVLEYGETEMFGPYKCTSKESGLTCTANGHGFTANRKGVKVH